MRQQKPLTQSEIDRRAACRQKMKGFVNYYAGRDELTFAQVMKLVRSRWPQSSRGPDIEKELRDVWDRELLFLASFDDGGLR